MLKNDNDTDGNQDNHDNGNNCNKRDIDGHTVVFLQRSFIIDCCMCVYLCWFLFLYPYVRM